MSVRIVKRLISAFNRFFWSSSSDLLISYLRKRGIRIGENVIFRNPRHTRIDIQRPSLVTIGNNVDINDYFAIMTHDWSSFVFLNVYKDFVNTTGEVRIGNNIYFGTNVTVLKGVSIGDNCIIGAGSLVNRSIPANSVAAGVPCKVICTLDEYYEKVKERGLELAKNHVRCYRNRFGQDPTIEDMSCEFIYFVNKENYLSFPQSLLRMQLGPAYEQWILNHESPYPDFDSFLSSID